MARPETPRPRAGIGWLRWVGTALSTALFIWLLTKQDLAAIWARLVGMPPWLPPLALLLYAAGLTGNSLRWYVLLRSQALRVPYVETFKIVFAGSFTSHFLPSTIGGDSVRLVSLARYTDNWTAGIATVFMDRLLGVFTMVTMLPFTWAVFGSLDGVIDLFAGSWGLRRAAGLSLGAGFMERWRSRLMRWMARVRETLAIWLRRPSALGLAFLVAWLARFMTFLALWTLARGLQIEVTIFQVMGVAAVTYVLTLLPISVNGYGVREFTVTSLYVFLGATLEQATALALVSRFLMMVETLPGAFWLPHLLPAERLAGPERGEAEF